MSVSDTNKTNISFNEETTWGETPSSVTMLQTRFTGESLSYAKQTVVSETIRDDRMRDQIALVGFNTEGDVEFELAAFDYDNWMEGAMFGTWTPIHTVSGTTIAATSTAFTDSGNGLAGIPVNAYVWVSGFTNKALNRRYRVTASAAGSITVSPAPAATASAGSSITIGSCSRTVTMATTTLTIVVAASDDSITFGGSTGFNPLTGLGIVAGQWIRTSGFSDAANNGIKRVSSVTATKIIFDSTAAMADETVTNGTVTCYSGRRLRNSTTSRSYHMQKAFTDVAQFMSMRGMRVGAASLAMNAGEIVTGSFSFMGKTVVRAGTTYATTEISSNTSPVMTASSHIGSILQNGTAIACGIRSLSLDIENNLRSQTQIGSTSPYGIGSGFMDVTGQLEAYFEDNTLYDQLINHTSTELSWQMTDDLGNVYVFTLPAVIFTEGYPQSGGGNDDVMIPLSYQAIRSSTYNCQVQIDLLPTLT